MSSSFVKDCSDASTPASSYRNNSDGLSLNAAPPAASGGNKTVFIIVNNDSQIDQDQLSSILASHAGASSEVSVVQMAGGGGSMNDVTQHDSPDATSTLQAATAVGLLNSTSTNYQDPLDSVSEVGAGGYSELPLDVESLHQLESVLCTDEARHLLASDNLLDILGAAAASGASDCTPAGDSTSYPTGPNHSTASCAPVTGASSGAGGKAGRGRMRAPPKRRSQRQQDKAERDEVTKILAENQRMLQREREELMAAESSTGSLNQNLEVQGELDYRNQDRPRELQPEASDNEQSGESDSEEEDSDDDDGQDNKSDDSDYTTRGLHNSRPVSIPRVAKAATRGRGRPRKNPADMSSVSGRGRLRADHEGGRGGGLVSRPGSLRGSRGRGRGRPPMRGSKGKHMPVMPEDEEDDELPSLDGGSEGPAAAVATEAEDDLDDLEKQLSDLHGGADAATAPAASPSITEQLSQPKKIVFLKKGVIGTNKNAPVKKKTSKAEPAVQRKSLSPENKEDAAKIQEAADDQQDEDEDGEYEEKDDDDDDGDYDPVKESEKMNAVDDATREGDRARAKKRAKNQSPDKSAKQSSKKSGSPSKKLAVKKAKTPKHAEATHQVVRRVRDKQGNFHFVKKKMFKSLNKERSEKNCQLDKKSVSEKLKSNPVETDYLKILQLAQKNVDDAATHAPKKISKSLPDPKSVLKKMKETMADNKPKNSISSKEHVKHKFEDHNKSLPSAKKKREDSSTAEADSSKSPKIIQKSPEPPLQKKHKLFSSALDVPYESLKTNKVVKKFATGSGIIGGSKVKTSATPVKRKDDSQVYKDANKQLLNKLTTKLGKVSKNVPVTVDFVQNKSATPLKSLKSSPKKLKVSPASAKYKEEFDEEDEELDDLEEYRPVDPVSADQVRRSNRAPKKKSFGDEMIMLGEDNHEDEADSSDDGDHDDKDLDKDNDELIDEDDEDQHTLKRRRGLIKKEEEKLRTVDVEVVDELPKAQKDEDFSVEELLQKEEEEEELSSEEEFVEEDDPERLWCICQRPHNNRFMICCDTCEDWFHGSCVGITKAMGKKMEEDGKEWICPNCKRATKTLQGSASAVGDSQACGQCRTAVRRPGSVFCSDACVLTNAASALRATHEPLQMNVGEVAGRKPSVDQQVKSDPRVLVVNNNTGHVLSGKDAPTLSELTEFMRLNPDYSLVQPGAVNPRRASESSEPRVADPRAPNKPGRITINVSKAAAQAGFKENLQSGSSSAPVTQTGPRKTILLTSVKAPPNVAAAAAEQLHPKPVKKHKPETPQPQLKQSKKRSRSESESSRAEHPPSAPAAPPTPAAPTVHDIRRNVRKALTDCLLRRCEQNRAEFPDVDKNKIEELVKTIENELFVYFNKSVNIKYKSRYRSLVFNIRDEKNGGLYRQILTGAVTPLKLATMTSDEMASKELAEWRQTQGKKELEAIQKHELDRLALGNTYIMKSHKGEIEIDKDDFIKDREKAGEAVKLPEEEPLVEELTGVGTSGVAITAATIDDLKNKSDKHSSSRHKSSRDKRRYSERDHRDDDRKHSRDDEGKSSRKKSRGDDDDDSRRRRHHSDRGDRRDKKERDERRDKDHKRDSDDRRDKDHKRDSVDRRDKDHKRHSDDGRDKDYRRDSDDRRHRDKHDRRDRDRKRHDSDRHRHDSKSDRREKKSANEVTTSDDVVERRHLDSIDDADEEQDAQPSSTVGPLPGEASYTKLPLPPNLPTHLPHDQDDLIPSTTPPPMEDDPSYIPPYSPEAIPPESPIPARNGSDKYMLDSPQTPPSPSSTPPLDDGEYSPSAPPYPGTPHAAKARKTKPKRSSISKFEAPSRSAAEGIAIWRGVVQMTDVAKFTATAFEVSGGSVNFTQDVPDSIDIVGRISPENVWSYIADTKKAASKEILVVRFQPSSEEEKVFYIALYSYLSSKKRYGVVGNCDRSIKDFYIIPLASHQPIPQVLLPLDGPGFEEQRPHMLVGVVVRTKPKRIYDQFSGTWKDIPDVTKLSEEGSAMLSELKEASERSFTPPLPGSAYDPEEEEEMAVVAAGSKKPESASELEILLESPIIVTPPGAPDDDSDSEIVDIPSNKAVKRSTDQGESSGSKKAKTERSKEQESMLAELNRQIEQHKKELSAMHESISQKDKVVIAASRKETVLDEHDKNDSDKNKKKDPVKLDTSKINIPDNLHMILEGIKRKEEEIKQKQDEIVRRKNEAQSVIGGDTDMRRMLLQPPSFASIPGLPIEGRVDVTTAPLPSAYQSPVAVTSSLPHVGSAIQVPPTNALGSSVHPPSGASSAHLPHSFSSRGPPPSVELGPPHPQLSQPPPTIDSRADSTPALRPPSHHYMDAHAVPPSPSSVTHGYPPPQSPAGLPPRPIVPPRGGSHEYPPSPHPVPIGPPIPVAGRPPRPFGPPPHMPGHPPPYREGDEHYRAHFQPPPEDYEYGSPRNPGFRHMPRDDHRFRGLPYDDYRGYPDERDRRYLDERGPHDHEEFDYRRGHREWEGPKHWRGRGRADWDRRGRGRGRW
ncbi:PHD finger protein 3 isoform X2 [Hyalella azteca]|uniref:PHD finger protein 3 isoform X2 n=1 Tax=Hyalella azteca TaxID=294128 RepID=A0A8B7PH30_HYAAZ|nr:PHD finger protein 3 isoform X2 [Hyalella azteca]